MSLRSNIRWSDNDRHFGPFTFARDRFARFGFVVTSANDEDRRAYARAHLAGFTLLAPLPNWLIRPHKVKVVARGWDAETIKRMGRDWYWDIHERQFGAYTAEGALHVHYGASTHDSSTDRSRCFFFPWRSWRIIRHSLYGCDGQHFADLLHDAPFSSDGWKARQRTQDECPTVSFAFLDFDGEQITVTTKIEEREWKLGEGRWRWLSIFRRPRVTRSLDITFSSEVGERKGSWKGGTIGHSIEMLPGELHEDAFRRYCPKEGLTFIGRSAINPPAEPGKQEDRA